ncbi:GNAT family N-acetyltransferase [Sphingomonas aracearum]|uniref:GNAT family N-acetyltransferase n=1 Tax=Sphingomonas aracearum TaxID=2283317 RepID=UPI001EF0CEF8|nr:GNAT family N-acetyltransferase [Sphingomonas aracearum]
MIRIERDDLSRADVVALVALHVAAARENSPPEQVFALDASGLREPAVALWTAWDGGELLGMGALKELDPRHGEIKSMRTAPVHQRKGVARLMLDHLIVEARGRGYRRLSLETGGNAAFAPARAMYEAAGFTPAEPFAGYTDRAFSRYYTLAL